MDHPSVHPSEVCAGGVPSDDDQLVESRNSIVEEWQEVLAASNATNCPLEGNVSLEDDLDFLGAVGQSMFSVQGRDHGQPSDEPAPILANGTTRDEPLQQDSNLPQEIRLPESSNESREEPYGDHNNSVTHDMVGAGTHRQDTDLPPEIAIPVQYADF